MSILRRDPLDARAVVDWPIYLAPEIDDLIPGNARQAMLIVGVVEIVAGLVVALALARLAAAFEEHPSR